MPTTKVKFPKRMGVTAIEDDVLGTAHGLAAALHRVGALDAVNTRDMDRLCLRPKGVGHQTRSTRSGR